MLESGLHIPAAAADDDEALLLLSQVLLDAGIADANSLLIAGLDHLPPAEADALVMGGILQVGGMMFANTASVADAGNEHNAARNYHHAASNETHTT